MGWHIKNWNIQKLIKSLLYLLLFVVLVGYIVVPLFNTALQAFQTTDGYSWANFIEYLHNPNNITVIRNTLVLGICSVFTCGILGTALAAYVTFLCSKWKKLIHFLLLTPMMIPGVIIVVAFVQMYGESGMAVKLFENIFHIADNDYTFTGFFAILLVITYTQYVYFYMNVFVALKQLDWSTVEAAKSLGAGKLKILKDVIWPTIAPAVITSTIITFASGVSAFSAPNLIGGGYKVLSTQIVRAKANNHMEIASVQVLILFIISLIVMLSLRAYEGKHRIAQSSRPAPIPKSNGKVHKTPFSILCGFFAFVQILMIVLPILNIIYLSFMSTQSIMTSIFPTDFTWDNYASIFGNTRTFKPLFTSVKMTLQAILAGLILTVPISYLGKKEKHSLGNRGVKILMMLPWCMPASVIAINLINAFNKPNIFAGNQILIGGYAILPIAYIIISLPLLLSSNDVAIGGFDLTLEDAAKSLGASLYHRFKDIILPSITPGIIAGALLVFVRTIGEYTMSALLYGVHNRPISISMITNMQEYKVGISMAYSVIVIVLNFVVLNIVFKLDKNRFM